MGFFDEAEINLNEIPSDPFGFGNDFHTVFVADVADPKKTANGDRFGMMVTWAIDEPAYQNTQFAEAIGYGNWMQLPVPKVLQGEIPWDPKSPEGQKVLFNLKTVLSALGFGADEMGKVGPKEMKGRRCLAKIKTSQNAEGFWQYNIYAFKALPQGSDSGMGEFAKPQSNTPADILKDELDD
jgi:hypothetical protein